MRVLVCGDRNWTAYDIIRAVLEDHSPINTVVHGGCRGADTIAGDAARDLGIEREIHPANWKVYGSGAGPIRNQAMLDTGIDLVLAFHSDLKQSKGTADMIRRAIKAGVTVEVYNGRV